MKSCPFCGGNASVYKVTDTEEGLVGYFVGCDDCDCRTTVYAIQNDAIGVWDKRAYEIRDNEMLNLLQIIFDSWESELDIHSQRMKAIIAAKKLMKSYED